MFVQRHRVIPRGLSKRELVFGVRCQENNFGQFAEATMGKCDQNIGIWRKDCLESPTAAGH